MSDKKKTPNKVEKTDREENGITREGVVKRLEIKYGIQFDDREKDTFRDKFRKVCRMIPTEAIDKKGLPFMTNLWTASVVKHGERKDHYFLEHEVSRVLNSPELDRYIQNQFMTIIKGKERGTKGKEYKELEETADEWNKTSIQARIEEIELIEKIRQEINQPEYETLKKTPLVTRDDAKRQALEIMIEAIFLRFYEPIDMELLWHDMELRGVVNDQPNGYSPEAVRDLKRLKYPVEKYCTPREPDSEN